MRSQPGEFAARANEKPSTFYFVGALLVLAGTTAAVQFNHENSIIIKAVGDTPRFITSYRDQFEAMWNDEFADFNGSFQDWVPEGSCL